MELIEMAGTGGYSYVLNERLNVLPYGTSLHANLPVQVFGCQGGLLSSVFLSVLHQVPDISDVSLSRIA